jgi:membrane protein
MIPVRHVEHAIRRADDAQQRSFLAVPVAVWRKFTDDQGGSLGATIAFHGFFSIFPLLLVLVTIAGYVFDGNPGLERRVVGSALRQFPVVGADIGRNVHALGGDVLTVVVGIVLALWSGLAVVSATQRAMDQIWDVPVRARPGAVRSRLRGLVLLLALGVLGAAGAIVATAGRALPGVLGTGAALALAFAINVGLFVAVFSLTTSAENRPRDVLPGAAAAAFAWTLLQAAGAYLVDRKVRGASDVYGFFAVVIGLLSWLYLGAQITLLCAELNVVRLRGLWPRSLMPTHDTSADRVVLADQAKEQAASSGERVRVAFEEPDGSCGV